MSSTDRTIDKVDIDTMVALKRQVHNLKRKLKKSAQESHKPERSQRQKTRSRPTHSLLLQSVDSSSSDSNKVRSLDERKHPVRNLGKRSKGDWSKAHVSTRHVNRRYWELYNEVEGCSAEIAVKNFKLGLAPSSELRQALTRRPAKNIQDLMSRIEQYVRVEEDCSRTGALPGQARPLRRPSHEKEAFNVMDHKKKKYIAVDRISELPDPLLQEILSFLPINQVVQSTILSKRWKHMSTSIPVLFYSGFYPSGYCNFVEKTIRSRSVKKFSLADSMDKPNSASNVDRWISFLVKNDVEELDLLCFRGLSGRMYELPQSVIRVLSGRMYQLPQSVFDSKSLSVFGDINITLPSLRKLCLRDRMYQLPQSVIRVLSGRMYQLPQSIFDSKSLTVLTLDGYDQTIHKLVAGCPVIQDMRFHRCHELKSMKFEGLTNAKSIVVEYNHGLEIVELEASNLYSLLIHHHKRCEIKLASCNNLKRLSLRVPNTTDKWFHDHLSQLPKIEFLEIDDCYMLERLKISSHSLKTLNLALSGITLWGKTLVEVDIDTPNLCKLAYRCSASIPFSLNALALSEATYHEMKPIAPWNVEKIDFLANLESFIGLEIVELVDSLLWISPLPEIMLIESFQGDHIFQGLPCLGQRVGEIGSPFLKPLPPLKKPTRVPLRAIESEVSTPSPMKQMEGTPMAAKQWKIKSQFTKSLAFIRSTLIVHQGGP
uniref:F-box domain-containing protein n=1 Tax=Fagus sylvatica TaxID=28930 RepID=A0A2N9HFM3_FAGSY